MGDRWNFNIDEAPKGKIENVEKKIKGKIVKTQKHVKDIIIATDGTIVTTSYWIPPTEKSKGRWNMFATGETPKAWQPWPDPPT